MKKLGICILVMILVIGMIAVAAAEPFSGLTTRIYLASSDGKNILGEYAETVYEGVLSGNEFYTPVLFARNDGASSRKIVLSAEIDGMTFTWKETVLKPGEYTNFFLIGDSGSKWCRRGEHSIDYYINGGMADSFSYTVFAGNQNAAGISVGDSVEFGHYPQNSGGNTGTAIAWLVLDVQPGKALLISSKALACRIYDPSNTETTWADCQLRTWLNNQFYNAAFSSDERKAILLTSLDNSLSQGNPESVISGGRSTTDEIFLLSYAEAKKYFKNDRERRCIATNWVYAESDPCTVSTQVIDGREAGWWWLRSPGISWEACASVVCPNGAFAESEVFEDDMVRPALWVRTDSNDVRKIR